MPRVREHCCLTSCEFYCLFLQLPQGAQVWLSSHTLIAVTLGYLGCIFGANVPRNVTQHSPGEQKCNGQTCHRRKSYISALTIGVFLALVSLHLATETGLLCGAESSPSRVGVYESQGGSSVEATGQKQVTPEPRSPFSEASPP